ncbi:MAG: hypothetical protein WC295_08515 [Methanoregula sp.]|jgi:hypothetical protein
MANKPNLKDFALSTGLVDDFDGTVVGVQFRPNPQYAAKANIDADTPLLHLTFEGPDIDTEDGKLTQAYSIGTGWEPKNKGAEVININKPDKHNFNVNSNAGALIKRMLAVAGGGDEQKGMEMIAERGIYMTKAEFYEGLSGHWSRETISRQGGGSGFSGGDSQVLLPSTLTVFPGIIGKKAAGKKAAPAADEGKPAVKPDEDKGGEEPGEFKDQIAWLKRAAPGKTKRQLKAAVAGEYDKDLSAEEQSFVEKAINGDLIDTLVKNDVLKLGDDGKTFA